MALVLLPFDITKDPFEWHNLADDPKFTEVRKELTAELDRWMKSQGDQGQQTELEATQHQAKWAQKNWHQITIPDTTHSERYRVCV